ncbi:MOSC domain-containing protein [Sulfurimonas sp.]|jgi:MOSC domain-containing protein YiiM|uniref:MOSC domain-containing protein n=1 Tax=Sulfurimonas sp. TaxID=2022749 RepID=UPI0025FFDDA6|nr:MOSC domain-containing protein [Sulfurimonas sp.]MBT5935365.1 MOSC domain-containing protein [Sulfurimonas sp.]
MITETTTGKVLALFITLNDGNKTRKSIKSIHVDELGIKNDKFYSKDSMRSILLSSSDSYRLTKEQGISIEEGLLGENILLSINPYHLKHGDTLKIGSTYLEITQNCTLCNGLSKVNPRLPKILKSDRGIFAKYIKGSSEIKVDDKVEILDY